MRSKTTKEINKKGNIIENKEKNSLEVSDFIHMFIAIHISQKNYCFNIELLLEFIDYCKNNDKYDELLNKIEISKINGKLYSRELDDQITLLRKEKTLYKNSLYDDSHIYINECLLLSKQIDDKTEYLDEMILFTRDYNLFEKNKIIKFYENFYKRKVKECRQVNKNFIRSLINND